MVNKQGSASPEQASIKIAEWLISQREHSDYWIGSYHDLAEIVGVSQGSASGYLATRFLRGVIERIAVLNGRIQYRVDLNNSDAFNVRRCKSPGGTVGRSSGFARSYNAEAIGFKNTRHLLNRDEHVWVLRNKVTNNFWLAPMGRNPNDCWNKAVEWEQVHGKIPEDWAKEMHANGWRAVRVLMTITGKDS